MQWREIIAGTQCARFQEQWPAKAHSVQPPLVVRSPLKLTVKFNVFQDRPMPCSIFQCCFLVIGVIKSSYVDWISTLHLGSTKPFDSPRQVAKLFFLII